MVSEKVQLGQFVLDASRYELTQAGIPVRMERIPMELLLLLVREGGRLVSREEIIERLWGRDVYFDTDNGINTAIRKIRRALGYDSEKPQYVETVLGKGYRIKIPVEVVTGNGDKISLPNVAQPTGPTDHRPNWLKIGAGILFGTVCIATLSLVYLRRHPRAEQSVLTPIPFTTFPGQEVAPTFSPDGTQLAFAWTGMPRQDRRVLIFI